MTRKTPVNVAASVRARLLKVSKERREDFTLTLMNYAAERFLYRLAQSKYRDRFVLKGAMLVAVRVGERYRPPRDLDLLGPWQASEAAVATVVRDIATTKVDDDGLVFDVDDLEVHTIREDNASGGIRAVMQARLAEARIHVQIDVGFGDAITPAATDLQFPTLLGDMPSPNVLAYPTETIVAEKVGGNGPPRSLEQPHERLYRPRDCGSSNYLRGRHARGCYQDHVPSSRDTAVRKRDRRAQRKVRPGVTAACAADARRLAPTKAATGGNVVVSFRDVAGALTLRHSGPSGFELCGATQTSGRWADARVVPSGSSIVLFEVASATRGRYARGGSPATLLADGSGPPAGPFEGGFAERWRLETTWRRPSALLHGAAQPDDTKAIYRLLTASWTTLYERAGSSKVMWLPGALESSRCGVTRLG